MSECVLQEPLLSPQQGLVSQSQPVDSPSPASTQTTVQLSNTYTQSPKPSRPAKRQKISLACQECRDKKTRCDGVRPICGSCTRKKRPPHVCVYEPDRGRGGAKNQYIQLLESKVRELENTIRASSPMSSETSVVTMSAAPGSTSFQNTTSPPTVPLFPSTTRSEPDHLSSSSAPPLTPSMSIAFSSAPDDQVGLQIGYPASQLSDPPQWTSSHSLHSARPTPLPLPPSQDATSDNRGELQVDAMGAVTGSTQGPEMMHTSENRHGYFGSSSAMSFMREVRQVIGKRTTLVNEYVSSSLFSIGPINRTRRASQSSRSSRNTLGRLSIASSEKNCPGILHDYVLPPRKVAEGFVWSYWTYVHTLYPFLHKPTFMHTYSKLWGCTDEDQEDCDDESEADPLFHCILNLVFALGCQLSPEISESEREPASDVFFQRSKKLLQFDILEAGNIKVVQALLLMGQYLQCTKMPGRCWIVVGLAIRVAQGLGLHLVGRNERQSGGSGGANQRDKELHKRLWGGCIVLDRVISMAYGRPFMIPVTRELVVPEIIDDDLLTSHPLPPARQPSDTPSHMAFFVYTLQLYEIMGDILTTLYSTGPKRRASDGSGMHSGHALLARGELDGQYRTENLNSIIRLEIALNTWEQSLPSFLRHPAKEPAQTPTSQDTADTILVRQTNVLRARYLHTCILLYRPLFVHYFASEESSHPSSQESGDTDLQKALRLQSSTTCVTIAQDLVEMIYCNIKNLLPAWWYNIFYLYTSATVLLMARLFPKIKEAIGENRLIESWNKCLGCLSEYQSYSGSAKGCYESLSELDKLVFQSNDEKPNCNMSSIQILGTLQNYNASLGQPVLDDYNRTLDHRQGTTPTLNPSHSAPDIHSGEWEFDLQDTSWLGRLPVYTDLEPGTNFNQWLG